MASLLLVHVTPLFVAFDGVIVGESVSELPALSAIVFLFRDTPVTLTVWPPPLLLFPPPPPQETKAKATANMANIMQQSCFLMGGALLWSGRTIFRIATLLIFTMLFFFFYFQQAIFAVSRQRDSVKYKGNLLGERLRFHFRCCRTPACGAGYADALTRRCPLWGVTPLNLVSLHPCLHELFAKPLTLP
jgi:hypothetical protein